MRISVVALAILLLVPAPASAEWQLRPFLGFTFGGVTTFIDLENAVPGKNPSIGVSGVWLGEWLGVEADLGFAPGFFQADSEQILQSGVTTFAGNLVVTLPRRVVQYSLRPYAVVGVGRMWVEIETTTEGVLRVVRSLPAIDVGGGVTGFLTDRVGVNWDLRYFRSLGEGEILGNSVGAPEQLSFWRANMALAIRY
jgi:hypothetical protein